jgi:hypothetical protein
MNRRYHGLSYRRARIGKACDHCTDRPSSGPWLPRSGGLLRKIVGEQISILRVAAIAPYLDVDARGDGLGT